MRIVLVLLIAVAACGKKKPAVTPAAPTSGSAAEAQPGAPAPAAPDSAPQPTTKSDPEEGGQ